MALNKPKESLKDYLAVAKVRIHHDKFKIAEFVENYCIALLL